MLNFSVRNIFCMAHLLLLPLFIHIASAQSIIKSVSLTPTNKINDGARLISNVAEVKTLSNIWNVLILSQSSWQFIISLDSSFGFDPYVPSAISVTMDASSIATEELLFGFTTDNAQYIAVSLPMDNIGRSNRIYPACPPLNSAQSKTTSFSVGDIASIPNFDRNCDIAGGSCLFWSNMIPPNHASDSEMPVTFILEYTPSDGALTIYLEDASLTSVLQSCTFGAGGFQITKGLKIYIAGNNPGETYAVSSFEVQSMVRDPTTSPTPDPTVSPTPQPTKAPTTNPTVGTLNPSQTPTTSPTANPTEVTANPSKVPTKSPTNPPSEQPTNVPTNTPTGVPTLTPTNLPSFSPTNKPTGTPTTPPSSSPSMRPTFGPTNPPTNPTLSPSGVPTLAPTNFPTLRPSTDPTLRPSNNPSTHPTPLPSISPTTAAPTNRAAPAGFVWGAHDQLCPEAVTVMGLCRDTLDYVSSSSVLCLQPYDCCMCDLIECGFDGVPCHEIRVGPFGAYGVKNIRVAGAFGSTNGATVDCQGRQSCSNTVINATKMGFMDCDGKKSCQNATALITDPKPGFSFECSGENACNGMEIEILFSGPPPGESCSSVPKIFNIPKVSCNSEFACEGLQFTINNQGCDKVVIEKLECIKVDACNDAQFNLIGDVEIDNCFCGPSCSNTMGLSQCFENLERVLCPDPSACANQKKTITNPKNGFEFICSDAQSCEGAEFLIELNENVPAPVYSLSKLLFGGLDSARDIVFIIDNQQAFDMSVALIECGGAGSCAGATFVVGNNVFIQEIKCAKDACVGCQIKRELSGPGIPCDSSNIRPLLQNLPASYV